MRHRVAVGDSRLEVGIVVGERHMAVEEHCRVAVRGNCFAGGGIVAAERHRVVEDNHLVAGIAVEEYRMVVEEEGIAHKGVVGNLRISSAQFLTISNGELTSWRRSAITWISALRSRLVCHCDQLSACDSANDQSEC